MANLFFPQLMSGALAQYPIQKSRMVRTVRNVLPDGNLILYSDTRAGHLVWSLEYTELSNVDAAAIQSHFSNCVGPLRAFTFIDPTDNMLCWSSDITRPVWNAPTSLQIAAGAVDPMGGTTGFTVINNGQAPQGIQQTLAVPANYQYVFSAFLSCPTAVNVTLSRFGITEGANDVFAVSSSWSRIASSGQLQDTSQSLTVSLTIGAGQQVTIYGPQLEAQLAPSRYRPTFAQGGVYPNAHWGVDQLPVVATAPGQFSTAFTVEATV